MEGVNKRQWTNKTPYTKTTLSMYWRLTRKTSLGVEQESTSWRLMMTKMQCLHPWKKTKLKNQQMSKFLKTENSIQPKGLVLHHLRASTVSINYRSMVSQWSAMKLFRAWLSPNWPKKGKIKVYPSYLNGISRKWWARINSHCLNETRADLRLNPKTAIRNASYRRLSIRCKSTSSN